jgi:putative phosphoesterase
MKVALIGDIHANLPALQAVLEHARQQNAHVIWNVGDFVGYGAFPDEVVTLIRQIGALSILGNYDRKTLKIEEKRNEWARKKTAEKWQAFEWAYNHLSSENRTYLGDLPEQRLFAVEDFIVLMTHGSPASRDEHLDPLTPLERLQELAQMTTADIILCGHSHQPFARQVNQKWFINPGSVGRPEDGDPRASYAIIDFDKKLLTVEHFRVSYDVERAAAAIRSAGLPEVFARMVLEGYNFDTIQAKPPEESSLKPHEE